MPVGTVNWGVSGSRHINEFLLQFGRQDACPTSGLADEIGRVTANLPAVENVDHPQLLHGRVAELAKR